MEVKMAEMLEFDINGGGAGEPAQEKTPTSTKQELQVKIAEKIINHNFTSEAWVKRLANIAMDLPSDFQCGIKDNLFVKIKKFLSGQDNAVKDLFSNEAHKIDPERHNFITFLVTKD